LRSFGDQVRAQAAQARQGLEVAQQKIALEVSKRVIFRTPVDTGRARGSWMPAIGAPAVVDPGAFDKEGGAAMRRVSDAIAKFKGDATFYLTSVLSYMPFLEEGSSKQAPNGMVAITVREFEGIAGMAVSTWRSAGRSGGFFSE
jgi:hypothetical protein